MVDNNCLNKNYNKFKNIRSVTRETIDYLIQNNQNLLKLLYYTDTTPLEHPNLTKRQIQGMVCKKPLTEDTSTKNILFQTRIEDGLNIAVPQLRIQMGDIIPLDPYRGGIELYFQIVVPNKQMLISTEYSDVDDRALAIFQELAETLNGTVIGHLSSPLHLDRRSDVGRGTGAYRETQNRNYSGYLVTFAALC